MSEKFDFSKIEEQQKFEELSQEEKDKIIGDGQEEGNAENLEKELSPEIIEKVMDKVQDIDKEGTAYSTLLFFNDAAMKNKLESVLKFGLLGTSGLDDSKNRVGEPFIEAAKWIENVRKKKESAFFFNIVGRTHFSGPAFEYREKFGKNLPEISNSYWFSREGTKIALLFDDSRFTEKEPIDSPTKKISNRSRVFRANQDYGYRDEKGRIFYTSENLFKPGLPIADSEFGFVGAFRVPPKSFRGLVLRVNKKQFEQETEDDPKKWEEIINHMVLTMTREYKNKEKLILPIYNFKGDLLWPKKMSYEKIKRFIAEKEIKEN
ncbi:MAG: hypothetical protein V1845_03750 [bacterium]